MAPRKKKRHCFKDTDRDTGATRSEHSSRVVSETAEDKHDMFVGLTAWFSTSVAKTTKDNWISTGGTLADIDDAMYVFSEDARADDTRRLYQTESYLSEHLAIFHPDYISDCISTGKTVAMGKYVLPPFELQDAVRKRSGKSGLGATFGTSRTPRLAQPKKFNDGVDITSPEIINDEQLSRDDTRQKSVTSGNFSRSRNDDTRSIDKQVIDKCHLTSKITNDEGYIDISDEPSEEGDLEEVVIGQNGWQVVLNEA